MTRIVFSQVKLKGVRRWKQDRKWRQETKTFMQTINPFNLNAAGIVKSRDEIMDELREEREKWYQNTLTSHS